MITEGQFRHLGPFLLMKPLGTGGTGDVHLAVQRSVVGIDRVCVVKVLHQDLSRDHIETKRFLHEARTVMQLTHRNVPRVFDVGAIDGRWYMAMELIVGRTLAALSKQIGDRDDRLSSAVAMHVTCEVLSALHHAHELVDPATAAPLAIVHRDVAPQNVLIDFDGNVVLIDFGLAMSRAKLDMTKPGRIVGRARYMAPERATGDTVDRRADLFSVGILGYELFTSIPFYWDLGKDEILGALIDGSYTPKWPNGFAPAVQHVLQRALQRDPSKRFASCDEMRRKLMGVGSFEGPSDVAKDELRDVMRAQFDLQADRAELAELLRRAEHDPTDFPEEPTVEQPRDPDKGDA